VTEANELHWRIAPDRGHPAASLAPAADAAAYPDEEGLRQRASLIVRGLSKEDLARWRRGYFKGGDPGKYLPTAALARVIVDPEDEMARTYLNDARSPKEHYHFAALNWARVLPLAPDLLTDETLATFRQKAANSAGYRTGPGTENHKVMWRGAGLVLADQMAEDQRFAGLPVPEARAAFKGWLRDYVRNVYHHGMGEWESSTYHMFCTHSLINIYDFAEDPEVRLLASALLDYYVGAYALKYTDGILCGPSQRGMAASPVKSITDQTGWLWWGATRPVDSHDARNWRYAMIPATSSWKPSPVLTALARRDLPGLPVTVRGAKPNYWFGQGIAPRSNDRQETLHIVATYTLGSLWSGYDVHGQTVRWQFAAAGTEAEPGAVTITGGHPWDGRTGDGLGKYEQTAQVDGSLVLMAMIPDAEALSGPANRAFDWALEKGQVTRTLESDPEQGGHPKLVLTKEEVRPEERTAWTEQWIADEAARCLPWIYLDLPEGKAPRQHAGWYLWQVRDSYLALWPLGGEARIGNQPVSDKAKRRAEGKGQAAIGAPAWIVDGRQVGFLLHTAERGEAYPNLASFAKALEALTPVGDAFTGEGLRFATPEGRSATVRWNTEDYRAAAIIDGSPVSFDDWPVFDSPFFNLTNGILRASDGSQGYEVDFTGELPVYRPLAPAED
jgi:hypothetical protein